MNTYLKVHPKLLRESKAEEPQATLCLQPKLIVAQSYNYAPGVCYGAVQPPEGLEAEGAAENDIEIRR